ncbi:MAG: MotA/TolQ/ExbB proton channel family protein [Gammaproteobacteria bacterium]|jgi:biopolymer transport protein ExbB
MLSGFAGVLAQGGFVVAVLILLSVVALTVVLVKLWQAWQWRALSGDTVEQAIRHWDKGERAQALLLVKNQRNPRARVLAHLLSLAQGALALPALKEEALRVARTAVADRASYLRILDVVATIAPLLGLFGTVLGMIEAFQAMEAAGSKVNPAVLSGGIWVALLTTAVGLAVAIPVSMVNSFFERRVETEALGLQDIIERICTIEAARHVGKAGIRAEKEKPVAEPA